MAELKPCPFCGGVPKLETHGFWSDLTKDFTEKTYGLICDSCHTSGWQFHETKSKAIEAWNRRAGDGNG